MASTINASVSPSGIISSADSSGVLQLQTAGTTAITVDASQNVGIGTASPTNKLSVVGADASVIARVAGASYGFTMNSDAGSGFRIEATDPTGVSSYQPLITNGSLQAFRTGNTERMRIDASGNVLVGQTSASGTSTGTTDFYSGGLVINPNNRTSSGSANCVWATGTGQFYRSTSSIKYKQNVNDAEYGLAEVMQLRPVTYQGKSEVDGEKRFGGFIAEEVDAIGLNEFVVYDEQDRPDSLGYDRMVSLLTKAIQELKAIVDTQAEQIKALQGASV